MFAQTSESTRAAATQAERQAKATTLTPYRGGKVERFLTRLENGGPNGIFGPTDGFGVRIGGIARGSGLALGPSWRHTGLFNGNLAVAVSGARAIGGDAEVAASAALPHVGSHRVGLAFEAAATRLPQERFFGPGLTSSRASETAFGISDDRAAATVRVSPARWLQITVSAGTLNTSSQAGRARAVPSIDTRFTPDDAPGFGQLLRYTTTTVDAAVDYRDVPGNPRSGGRYRVGLGRYSDGALHRYSFSRIDIEIEQHFSAWKKQRMLSLRAIAAGTLRDGGQEVPFHLQPTLGGSRVLRGFVTDRFRDRTVVAAQAEYGWDLLPFISAVAFAEGGTTAVQWKDISTRNLRSDYGLGLRFGSARTVAFRTDVAFGSGEGARVTMRFNHAF